MQGLRPSGPGFALGDGRVVALCSIPLPFPRQPTDGTHRALCFAVHEARQRHWALNAIDVAPVARATLTKKADDDGSQNQFED
jgi:hypothetical protein